MLAFEVDMVGFDGGFQVGVEFGDGIFKFRWSVGGLPVLTFDVQFGVVVIRVVGCVLVMVFKSDVSSEAVECLVQSGFGQRQF